MQWLRLALATETVFCVAGLLALGGCGEATTESPRGGQAGRPAVVEVADVERADLSRQLTLTGEVVARQRVVVAAMVEGVIGSLPWHEGERVERGESLVEIDRSLYRAERDVASAVLDVAEARLADLCAGTRQEEIEEARASVERLIAALAYAESDLYRTRRLVETQASPAEALERAEAVRAEAAAELKAARQRLGRLEAGPTPTAVATAEAQVAEAQARLRLAEEKLAECRIAAPFAGVISSRYASAGDLASPHVPLLEMYDPASMVVRFAVPEWASGSIEPDHRVRVRFDALGQRSFDAHVVRVVPVLEEATRTRIAEVVFDHEIGVLPGMFARIEMTAALSRDALVVPSDALIARAGQGRAVMVVHNGRAQRVDVRVGIQSRGLAEVSGDVEVGDRVVVFGHEGLAWGAAVEVRRDDAASERSADRSVLGEGR